MNTITIIAITTGFVSFLAYIAIQWINQVEEIEITPIPESFINSVKDDLDLITSHYRLGKIDRETYMSLRETVLKMAENVADEHLKVLERGVE